MTSKKHPTEALFDGEKSFANVPSCEHFAGSEKLILKAFQLQEHYGPIFDITCDCEDGAVAGGEQTHAEMIGSLISSPANKYCQAGVRIHDPTHSHWRRDVDIIMDSCGEDLAYITIPKAISAEQVAEVIDYIQVGCRMRKLTRTIPIHVLIETHGALAEVGDIAALPWLQILDFGQMDFVSAHAGAIPASAMRSPNQFEHPLIMRAKTEIVAAALRHGLVPSHNVCLDLKNSDSVFSDASRAHKEFGFLRMWSIYPTQIEPIVHAMRPDFSEVEDGAAILLQAQAKDWGPIQYKGGLHDRATYRYFWTILQRAMVSGGAIPEQAMVAFFAGK